MPQSLSMTHCPLVSSPPGLVGGFKPPPEHAVTHNPPRQLFEQRGSLCVPQSLLMVHLGRWADAGPAKNQVATITAVAKSFMVEMLSLGLIDLFICLVVCVLFVENQFCVNVFQGSLMNCFSYGCHRHKTKSDNVTRRRLFPSDARYCSYIIVITLGVLYEPRIGDVRALPSGYESFQDSRSWTMWLFRMKKRVAGPPYIHMS